MKGSDHRKHPSLTCSKVFSSLWLGVVLPLCQGDTTTDTCGSSLQPWHKIWFALVVPTFGNHLRNLRSVQYFSYVGMLLKSMVMVLLSVTTNILFYTDHLTAPFRIQHAELWELLSNFRWTENIPRLSSDAWESVVSSLSHTHVKGEITECSEFQMEESL